MHTRLVVFLILCFFPIISSAREIEVVDRNLGYRLTTTPAKIEYEAEGASLSLVKKECNEHILNDFNKQMDKIFSEPFSLKGGEKFIYIKINHKVGYELRSSKRSLFLLSVDQRIKKLKIEEQFNCSKSSN